MSIQLRTTETVSARSRTDPRPDYILVGIDTEDAYHVYRTTDESVHVINNTERSHRYDLEVLEQTINDWIDYVKTRRGFTTQHLYTSLADSLTDAIGGEFQMTDTTDLENPAHQTNDRPALYVGDHVRDVENPAQTLLVAERTTTPAHAYTIGDTSTTVADIHPEYDPDNEIVLVAHPQPTIFELADLLTYPVPRARLELVTPLPGGGDR